MVPFAKLRPAGKIPAVNVDVYGGVPPTSGKPALYATPEKAVCNCVPTNWNCGLTTKPYVIAAVFAGVLLSVTCTVKVKAPNCVGVPDKSPLVLSVRPVGNGFDPETSVQVR